MSKKHRHNESYKSYKYAPAKPVWTVDPDKNPDCAYEKAVTEASKAHDFGPTETPAVHITANALVKVLALVMDHSDTEFMVYLLGDAAARRIDDVYVPKQLASVAGVELDEVVTKPGIIGALHKHPGDGKPAFSGTDDNCLNVNHDISIVIPQHGYPGHWHVEVRLNAACGCRKRVVGKVIFDIVSPDLAQVRADGRVQVPKTSSGSGFWGGREAYGRGYGKPASDVDGGAWKCTRCPRAFDSYTAREDHVKTHDDTTVRCPMPGCKTWGDAAYIDGKHQEEHERERDIAY